MKRINLFFLLIAFVSIVGCNREEETRWDIQGRFPLVKGAVSWSDLVPDSLVALDQLGVVHFVLDRSLIDFQLDTLVGLPDTVIQESYTLPFAGGPIPFSPGQELTSLEENKVLGISTAQIHEARIISGTLEYAMNSSVDGALAISYDLPGVDLSDGSSLILSAVSAPASLADPWMFEGSQDLSGATIDLRGLSGSNFNRLATYLDVVVDPNATADAQVFGDDTVQVEIRFRDVKIAYARGYFGQRQETTTSEVDISPFVETSGSFDLESISLQLAINNPVGVDMSVLIDEITAVRGNEEIDLVHSVVGQQLNITRALDNNGTVSPNEYNYFIDQSNSNLTSLVGILPDYLVIESAFELNPLGDVSGGNDFLYTDQLIEANLFLDIPMAFSSSGITLKDTLSIAPFEGEINASTELSFFLRNYFPLAVNTFGADLISQDGERVTLVENLSMDAASYLSLGEVQANSSTHTQMVSEDVIARLQQGGYIEIEISLATFDGEIITLSGNEKIEVSILADGDFELTYQ